MPAWFVGRAEVEAKESGHKIVWDFIGDRMANGRCSTCDGDFSVAISKEGMCETTGVTVERYCQPKYAAVGA